MKKSFLSFCSIIGFSLISNATVWTVSNDVNSPGQFTSAQAAHDAASTGDTLYIHATENTYGDLNINKPLVVLGEGSMPNKQIQYSSIFNNINFSYADFPAISNSSGSKLIGLKINGTAYMQHENASGTPVRNISFERCQINSISGSGNSNIAFYNNIINYMGYMALYSSVITNNIIQTINLDDNSGFSNIVSNNIIQNGLTMKGAIISNNIFYNFASSGTIDNGNGNKELTWSNNLFFAAVSFSIGDIIFGTNTGTGNIINSDPKFVNPILPNTLHSYSYSFPATGPYANFHLQATSPGLNNGTDGTDIGIYGGPHPWVDGTTTDSRYRYFTMPSQVPHMISMDVLNPTIPVNGTLNIQFSAKTQQ
jgi:hypothetical protein